MLIEQTLDKLHAMKLGAMAEASLRAGEAATLSFEERLGLLVDTEWTAREQRKLTRRLQAAKLRYAASLGRRLHPPSPAPPPAGPHLGQLRLTDHHNLLITGPTGSAPVPSERLRRGFTATGLRMPRLLQAGRRARRWLLHTAARPPRQTGSARDRRLAARPAARCRAGSPRSSRTAPSAARP